jgi:hypothetical protein
MKTLQDILDNETYKQVLKDSFGGVMYNVANKGKYDAKEILETWENLLPGERSAAGGIVNGAINFLKGDF